MLARNDLRRAGWALAFAVVVGGLWAGENTSGLEVMLTSAKESYVPGEDKVFVVTVKNVSDHAVPVVVRALNWEDIETLDRQQAERLKLGPNKQRENPADAVRARGGVEPLGDLELVPDEKVAGAMRFDLCGLSCGTLLKRGDMPPGTVTRFEYKIAGDTKWGPPGKYAFVWRVAGPPKSGSVATSNVCVVEVR